MIFERGFRLAELFCQGAGAQIACGAVLEHDAPHGERLGEGGIVHYRDAVADALGAQQFDGFSDVFGAADFAGVADDTQTFVAGQIESGDGNSPWGRRVRRRPCRRQ